MLEDEHRVDQVEARVGEGQRAVGRVERAVRPVTTELARLLDHARRDVDPPHLAEVPSQRAREATEPAAEVQRRLVRVGQAQLPRGDHQALDLRLARAKELLPVPSAEAVPRLGEH
jgi:hypothetical protein